MNAAERLSLHVPEPGGRPGGKPDFDMSASPRQAKRDVRLSTSIPPKSATWPIP